MTDWSCIVRDIETEWERNRLRRQVERLTAWGPLVDVLEENRVLRARLSSALGSGGYGGAAVGKGKERD